MYTIEQVACALHFSLCMKPTRLHVTQLTKASRIASLLITSALALGCTSSEEEPATERLAFSWAGTLPNTPPSNAAGLCVNPELTAPSSSYPDCVVLIAEGPATDVPSARCEVCDRPGLRVPTDESVARGIVPTSGSDCFCEVVPRAGTLDDRDMGSAEPGWYFLTSERDPKSGAARSCAERASEAASGAASVGATLLFPGTLLHELGPRDQVLTVACYTRE